MKTILALSVLLGATQGLKKNEGFVGRNIMRLIEVDSEASSLSSNKVSDCAAPILATTS